MNGPGETYRDPVGAAPAQGRARGCGLGRAGPVGPRAPPRVAVMPQGAPRASKVKFTPTAGERLKRET